MPHAEWIMEELDRATQTLEFADAYAVISAWQREHPPHWHPGHGHVHYDEPPPVEVAAADLTIQRLRIEAMERAGARYQRAVETWRAVAVREAGGPFGPWPSQVRQGNALEYPVTRVLNEEWAEEE
jgi:hypothetical protein